MRGEPLPPPVPDQYVSPDAAESYGTPDPAASLFAELPPRHRRGNLTLLARETSHPALSRWKQRRKAALEVGRRSSPRRGGAAAGGKETPPRQSQCPEAPHPLPPRSHTHVLSVTPSCSVFSASPPAEGSRQLPLAQTRGSLGNLFLHAAFTFREKTVCGSAWGRKADAGRSEVEEMLYSSRGEGGTPAPRRSPAQALVPRGRRAADAVLPSVPGTVPNEVGAGGSAS